MRKALLLVFAIALTAATLTTKPAEAAKVQCGCWCGGVVYYSSYSCAGPDGWVTCRYYYNTYCL